MRVPPFEMSAGQVRAELAPLRADLSIAVVRAKNPFNVGAIIRVAHSFLVREIFLVGSEPYYERASMGMHRYETIVPCPDEQALLAAISGRPLCAVERDHARTTLWEADFPRDVVLLFGSEDDGVPPALLAASAQVIAIPMYGINHSFPLAVAAGIVLCEWARRRDPRGRGRGPTEPVSIPGPGGAGRG
ncbi:MAG: TrmH family RNA methyltransferase [Deltaproteobacteria bacterium]|nr:TrmH family RNA methyltransferase [Deltaproteobacteria bacterium]